MEHEVGKVSKQWGGLAKEMFTDADSFGVTCKFYYCRYDLNVQVVHKIYEYIPLNCS